MLMEMVEQLYDAIEPEVIGSPQEPEIILENGAGTRERVLRLPSVIPTEISVGQNPGSEDRKQFELWMKNIGGLYNSGNDESAVSTKIKTITAFFKNPAENLKNTTVPETLSYLMFLNQFVWMLKEFNASVAGFLWEPFLAALFEGDSKQVPTSEGDISDIRIITPDTEEDISLKILNRIGSVKGSFSDLVNHFAEGGKVMRYVIVVKDQSAVEKKISSVNFYEFDIDVDNFFSWIGSVAHEEKQIPKRVERFTFLPISRANRAGIYWTWGAAGSPKSGKGIYLWIRHSKQHGGHKTQQEKWLRLGKKVDPNNPNLIQVGADTASQEAIAAINLQGFHEDGLVDLENTELGAEVALFRRSRRPAAEYVPQAADIEGMPGIASKGKGGTDDLWGSVEKLKGWGDLANEWNDSERLFKAIRGDFESQGIQKAPGIAKKGGAKTEGGTQFVITPSHYKGKGDYLGNIRITDAAVKTFFQEAARGLNDDLVLMFNSLADLTDNIGRFFLVDCGGSKCTPEDGAKRNTAGEEAIKNSGDLQRTVDASVKGIKEGGAAVSLGPSLGGRDARGEFEGGTKPTYENKELNLTNDDEVVIIEIER
tara:strand:- start:165 stop:1952 length:1788 start_codon:yes stop_codon:yes gene_type:complete